jgi:MoaA/NifB/PqqE/SkfB family radical SAM enzyme
MCGIWQKDPGNELTLDEIDRFFRLANSFSWINLTGGEIFQRPDHNDIFRIVTANCRQLYLLNFPTNGCQSDAIVAGVSRILAQERPARLMATVSMDGPPQLHDSIRGLPGLWEQAMETYCRLRKLQSDRFSVFLGYTLQKENIHAFPGTMHACRGVISAISAKEFHINVAQISGHYYDNRGFAGTVSASEARQAMDAILAMRGKQMFSPVALLERRYQKLAATYLETGITPLPCQAANASCFIAPDGRVFACTGHDSPIGSLRDHDMNLHRLWDSPERLKLRREIRGGNCPGCWTPCEAYQTILGSLLPIGRRMP